MARAAGATVTLSQIAELAGVRPSAVSNWRKRFDDFPRPVATAPGGRDVFALHAVEDWLTRHDRSDPDRTRERLLFEVANLLRGEMAADEAVQVFASAIALAAVLPPARGAESSSAAARVDLAGQRDPALREVFDPLLQLDGRVAAEVLRVADELDPDERADVFEWVLSRRSRFVETRTSDDLIELLMSLIEGPRKVLDPAAGEGGLLAGVGEGNPAARLFGQEINQSAWRTAVQRSLLRNLEIELRLGDSLLNDWFPELRVDTVVCDPPYNLRNPLLKTLPQEVRQLAPWASFAASRARMADLLWLEHALAHLASDGVAYVVLPAGSLSRGARERDVRVELIRRGVVDAVIALPAGSAQHTSVSLALWILRGSPAPDRSILMVDTASTESSDVRGLSREVTDRIQRIVRQWRSKGSVAPEETDVASAVSVVDVLANDADLTPSRYRTVVSPSTPEERARLASSAIAHFVAARNRIVHAASEPLEPDQLIAAQWVAVRELVAGEVAEVVRGVRIKPEDCLRDGVRVIRTRDLRDANSDKEPCFVIPEQMKPRPVLTEPADIILSPASGRLRAIVDEEGGHVLAWPLQALRFRTDWLDPYVAAAFLESPRNRRFARGAHSGYARVDIRDLEVPALPLEDARTLRGALDQLTTTERDARELAARAREVRENLLNFVGYTGDDT
jgi:type I restriction-modification system DNA methylase subunit